MNIDDICRLPSLKPTSSHLKMEGCWNTIVSFLGVCLFSGATLLLVLGSVTTITSEIQLLDTKNVPTKKGRTKLDFHDFQASKCVMPRAGPAVTKEQILAALRNLVAFSNLDRFPLPLAATSTETSNKDMV